MGTKCFFFKKNYIKLLNEVRLQMFQLNLRNNVNCMSLQIKERDRNMLL